MILDKARQAFIADRNKERHWQGYGFVTEILDSSFCKDIYIYTHTYTLQRIFQHSPTEGVMTLLEAKAKMRNCREPTANCTSTHHFMMRANLSANLNQEATGYLSLPADYEKRTLNIYPVTDFFVPFFFFLNLFIFLHKRNNIRIKRPC